MLEKIKKINILYLLTYIIFPMIICALCYSISFAFFPVGQMAAILIMTPTILAIVWWVFGGVLIFKNRTKKLQKDFVAAGYKSNHTFYGRGQTVVLDIKKGVMGLVFFWNPGEVFIFPVSRVTQAWVDDGKMGTGFMEGSSRVQFLFLVDGIKVAVPTFVSNQRFRMDDKRILTGISKADMMVKSITEAKQSSEAQKVKDKKTDKAKETKTTSKSEEKPKKEAKSKK